MRTTRGCLIDCTERELNTILAALQFWKSCGLQCAHGDWVDEASDAYKIAAGDWPREDKALSADEVQELMTRIQDGG